MDIATNKITIRNIFNYTLRGLVCSVLAATIYSASDLSLLIVSHIDKYGINLLNQLNTRCKIIVTTHQMLKEHKDELKHLEERKWLVKTADSLTHDKYYISVSKYSNAYLVIEAWGSANLSKNEVLCRSINNLNIRATLYGDKNSLLEHLHSVLRLYITNETKLNELNNILMRCV